MTGLVGRNRARGPETPTLIERFVGFFHLPYPVGCVVAALVLPPIGGLVGRLVDGLETSTYVSSVEENFSQASYLVFLASIFYLLYAPHYMRARLVGAEKALAVVLENGENDFHNLFGRVSARLPQLVLWVSILAFIFAGFASGGAAFGLGVVLANLIPFAPLTLGVATVIWVYYTSLRAIHRMGTSRLNLSPFYQDRYLGLRPVGSLALSLVAAYFAFIGLFLIQVATSTQPVAVLAFTVGMILLGLLMFFAPLRRLHQRMVEHKTFEKNKLNEELAKMHQDFRLGPSADLSQSFYVMSMAETIEKKISSMGTWPFDTQVLGKLLAIILSIVAILLSKALAPLFGL